MEFVFPWDFVIKIFIVGIIPLSFLSKEQSLYFKIKYFNLSIVFNVFAGFFATSIFTCLYFTNENALSEWGSFKFYLGGAVLFGITYFIILLLYKDFIEDTGRKNLWFEIKKLKKSDTSLDKTTLEDQQREYREMIWVVITHFIVYQLIFIFIAIALAIHNIISLYKA